MSSRVVISRLGQVGAVLRCKRRPCIWSLPTVWNRGYSQDTMSTGASDPDAIRPSVLNAPLMGKNFYARAIGPVAQKIIVPLRPWLSEAAGEWAEYTSITSLRRTHSAPYSIYSTVAPNRHLHATGTFPLPQQLFFHQQQFFGNNNFSLPTVKTDTQH